ncbi:hypothetical protein ILYODFUR_036598, partial [Ilyodon furcidens]
MSFAAGLDVRMENALLCMLGFFLLSSLIYAHADAGQSEPGNRSTNEVSNRASVTLQHIWPQIFRGERVTLRCEIQGGGGAQWTYYWSSTTKNSPSSSEFRINTATESYSGEYRCLGRRGHEETGWSDALRLTVL